MLDSCARRDIFSFLSSWSERPTNSLSTGDLGLLPPVSLLPGLLLLELLGLLVRSDLGDLGDLAAGLGFVWPGMDLAGVELWS